MPPVSVRFRTTAATRRLSPEGVTGTADGDCEASVARPGSRGHSLRAQFQRRTVGFARSGEGSGRSAVSRNDRPAHSPAAERFRRALQLWGHLGHAGGQRPGGRFQRSGVSVVDCEGSSAIGGRTPFGARLAATAPRTRPLPARPTTTWRHRSPGRNTTSRNLAFRPGPPAGDRFRLLAGEAAVPEWEWPDRFGTRRWPAKPEPARTDRTGFMVQLPCCATGNATYEKTQRKELSCQTSVRLNDALTAPLSSRQLTN